jgi:hypothetical protein
MLEAHGYEDLLRSFSRELKEKPSDRAWLSVGEIVFEGVMKLNERLRQQVTRSDVLAQELIETGRLLPSKQLELMNIQPAQIVELPKPLEVEMRRRGFFYLQALTHPALLQSRILMQEAGYQPLPGKEIPLFERLLEQGVACTYEDFGLKPRGAVPTDGVQESSSKILAQGCYSWISKNHVGFPTTSNSMPSTNSVEALASLALTGTFACIPTDGHLVSLESRLRFAQRLREAIHNHPVVMYHKHRDHVLSNGNTVQQELRSRTDFVVATLKQNPKTVVDEAKALYGVGVRAFRVYDAGSTNQMYEAVALLRKHLPKDITIIAGQVTSVEQARILVELGADALIVGIGEGGICTTPVVGSLAPDNILVAYELCKAGLGVPVLCDGGVGRAAGVIFAMGASGSMASRRIIGGTLEQSPTLYWVRRNGHLEKPYAGEASGVIKILGGNTTMAGDPYNLEGISSYVKLNEEYPSVASLYSGLLAGFTKIVRFSRAHSLDDLMRRPDASDIKMFSDGARAAAGAHHVQGHVELVLYGMPVREYLDMDPSLEVCI